VSERAQELVAEYQQRVGEPELSTRELSRRMRASGVRITHGTLQNVLNGATTPDRSTLRAICAFFGVSEYYFDAEPRSAEIMGRIGGLDQEGLDAIERLLADLDDR
jgi:transcriptional regulator with XRE-family HTH domain